jgi:hypothetical protein
VGLIRASYIEAIATNVACTTQWSLPLSCHIAAQIRDSSRRSVKHEELLLTPEEGVRRCLNLLRTAMVSSSRYPPPSNPP